ncbi:MAG: ABC transporter ATP-binding protein [Firmicutes bacterium HGW-Firmicutes-2]|nr:MAG: ABC transporter ATP-binding protein [Firmicutes bacterium HGW-Firmicutes-2]
MSNILMSVKKIHKHYGRDPERVHVLKSIDLDIEKGESVSIMGQSGSGKSTLLTIMGGLNEPTEGALEIKNTNLYDLNHEKRAEFRQMNLGFVFQQFQLLSYLTAIENVMLPLVTLKLTNKEKRFRAMKVLKRVGLEDKAHRLPNQLSGGEQERVAIARAIVNEPEIVLADEPTGSLDTKTGDEIMNVFGELNASGMTVIMVTHNPVYAKYFKRVITMKDGQLTNLGG